MINIMDQRNAFLKIYVFDNINFKYLIYLQMGIYLHIILNDIDRLLERKLNRYKAHKRKI